MYSQKARLQFIKTKVCQDDPVLYKYYEEATGGSALARKRFRKRLGKADLREAVQTLITDATRDILLQTIRLLGRTMRPMGDLIVSGGEAFNMYFQKEDRIITTDIDTKFCPFFRTGPTEFISSRDPRFFSALQVTKLIMWNKLGQLAAQMKTRITQRVAKVAASPLGKLLGIRPVKGLFRRYTLIPKKKQFVDSLRVKEGDVLIDVELFALDLKVWFLGKKHVIPGLLDIAFMRPSEVGYEVLYSRQERRKGLLVASKKFLIEDLYLLQSLRLRPKKTAKDRLRMSTFATKVLGVPVSPQDTMKTIFFKCLPRVKEPGANFVRRRPLFNMTQYLRQASRIDPKKYPSVQSSKVLPCASAKGIPTRSQYAFDAKKHMWTLVNSPMYVRNQANYRGGTTCYPGTLYGYSPARNTAAPKWLINKAVT